MSAKQLEILAYHGLIGLNLATTLRKHIYRNMAKASLQSGPFFSKEFVLREKIRRFCTHILIFEI
jgi:hypothetical protein